jgi:hypothetical protein
MTFPLKMIWYPYFFLFVSGIWSSVQAYSEVPYSPAGPYIRRRFLRTTTIDHLLWATIDSYEGDGDYTVTRQTNATINLKTGSVIKASPAIELTVPPEPLLDPTGGYRLEVVEGATARLIRGTREIKLQLEIPDLFGLSDTEQYFFVSISTYQAYIFYEIELDCRSGVIHDLCINCVLCGFTRNRAAIVNVTTGTVQFVDFDFSY